MTTIYQKSTTSISCYRDVETNGHNKKCTWWTCSIKPVFLEAIGACYRHVLRKRTDRWKALAKVNSAFVRAKPMGWASRLAYWHTKTNFKHVSLTPVQLSWSEATCCTNNRTFRSQECTTFPSRRTLPRGHWISRWDPKECQIIHTSDTLDFPQTWLECLGTSPSHWTFLIKRLSYTLLRLQGCLTYPQSWETTRES